MLLIPIQFAIYILLLLYCISCLRGANNGLNITHTSIPSLIIHINASCVSQAHTHELTTKASVSAATSCHLTYHIEARKTTASRAPTATEHVFQLSSAGLWLYSLSTALSNQTVPTSLIQVLSLIAASQVLKSQGQV